jgi:hypothetical protein
MGIHVYFNISKLIYSFISRRDIKFMIIESLGSLITILGAWISIRHFHLDSAVIQISSLNQIIFYSSLWGAIFIGCSLISRLFVKKNPEELAAVPKNNKVISIGIIDFAWITVMGISYSLLLFCLHFNSFSPAIECGFTESYYRLCFDETSYLFGKAIDIALVFGTVLCVCMTILWGGELWRKRDNKSRKDYLGSTIASIRMVFAFFVIIGGEIIWIIIPLLVKLTSIKSYFLNH